MFATALVTGVGGFIGSELARQLRDSGVTVVGVDNFSLGHDKNVPSGIEFLRGDLSDENFVKSLDRESFDVIFHLAGQSGGELSFSDPLFDLDANVRSTHLLIQLMQRIGCRKLVYASSVAAYGDAQAGEDGLIEFQEVSPTSPYGISKRASEEYLRVMSEFHNLETASLRLFNVYGSGQDLKRMNQGMLSIYLGQALKNGEVIVKGSFDRYRDFVHVSDAAKAFLAVADNLKTGHEVFNVCSGVRTFVKDALEELQESFGGNLIISSVGSTPGDVNGWVGSRAKIQSMCGWSPARSFSEGFREMIQVEKNRWSE